MFTYNKIAHNVSNTNNFQFEENKELGEGTGGYGEIVTNFVISHFCLLKRNRKFNFFHKNETQKNSIQCKLPFNKMSG